MLNILFPTINLKSQVSVNVWLAFSSISSIIVHPINVALGCINGDPRKYSVKCVFQMNASRVCGQPVTIRHRTGTALAGKLQAAERPEEKDKRPC